MYDISNMTLELSITETTTDCTQPIMYSVSSTAIMDMCLSIYTMVGMMMPTCAVSTIVDEMCTKTCEAMVAYEGVEIMIHAMPPHKMMSNMAANEMMNNVSVATDKGA